MILNVDLVYFGKNAQDIIWNLGKVVYAGKGIWEVNDITKLFEHNSNTEWVLFVNIDHFELPEQNHLSALLSNSALDIYHAGNKLEAFNTINYQRFVNPVWIYNLLVNPVIESTSLKLSVDCFAVRKSSGSFFKWDNPFDKNDSISLGVYWGFQLYNSGFILRYSPVFRLISKIDFEKPSIKSELLFIRLTSGMKWVYWAAFRMILTTGKVPIVINSLLNAKRNSITIPIKFLDRKNSGNIDFEKIRDIKISVFAPTLNRYTYLARELELLNKQTLLPFEVFITDQTDQAERSSGWIPKNCKFNIIYQPQDEKGQCNAWNYCLENAKGDYFLFLGDDADHFDEYFIEKLAKDLIFFNADVVGCNIREKEGDYPYKQTDVIQSDTFPICLVSRKIFQKSGGYDFAFNKGVRADGELIIRMHQKGALVLLDPRIKIYHHRAPIGGLRHHKERVVTRQSSKRSFTQFNFISFTERYLWSRHFNSTERKEAVLIKTLNLVTVENSLAKTFIKLLYFIVSYPLQARKIRKSKFMATELLKSYPQIPEIK